MIYSLYMRVFTLRCCLCDRLQVLHSVKQSAMQDTSAAALPHDSDARVFAQLHRCAAASVKATGLTEQPAPLAFIWFLLSMKDRFTAWLRLCCFQRCYGMSIIITTTSQFFRVKEFWMLKCVCSCLPQVPVRCPQSWNRQGTQPLQPASTLLRSDMAESTADRARDRAASITTVPLSDSATERDVQVKMTTGHGSKQPQSQPTKHVLCWKH